MPSFKPLDRQNISAVHVCAIAAMLLTCAGCGGSKEPSNPSPPSPAAADSSRGTPPPSSTTAADGSEKQAGAKQQPRNDSAKSNTQAPLNSDVIDTFAVFRPRRYQVHFDQPIPEQQFYAVRPPEGVTSSSYLARRDASSTKTRRTPTLRLPQGFEPILDKGVSADGAPLRIRCLADEKEMALVPGGLFVQGSEQAPSDAQPPRAIIVDTFYMDVTEVTVGEYESFLDQYQRERRRRLQQPVNADAGADMPALGINWQHAVIYARRMGKVLPTEAEWEKAARGAKDFRFPWGNGRPLWRGSRAVGQIDPVGSYPSDRSLFGILDMAGNAREWCWDYYSATAYESSRDRGGTAPRNWSGPKAGDRPNLRVVRSGADDWSVWTRMSADAAAQHSDVGFRCVLRIGGDETSSAAVPEPGEAAKPTPTGPSRPAAPKF